MTGTALAIAIAALAGLALAAVLRRRRRTASALDLDPLPAGLKHLASHVGSLSHLGSGLPVSPGARWRRLGTLLGIDR